MGDADRLLGEFIEQHLAGRNPDPGEFVERAGEGEREELAGLIDAYYVEAPRRPWDEEAFAGSPAEQTAARLSAALASESGLWPEVLPRLRDRARLKRSELVSRLAERLGVADRREKVDAYYHAMEFGTLSSAGVSGKVLEALAGIVGTSAEYLREMGERVGRGPAGGEEAVFARTALLDRADVAGAEASSADLPEPEPGREEWDEVDELFRGGPTEV